MSTSSGLNWLTSASGSGTGTSVATTVKVRKQNTLSAPVTSTDLRNLADMIEMRVKVAAQEAKDDMDIGASRPQVTGGGRRKTKNKRKHSRRR